MNKSGRCAMIATVLIAVAAPAIAQVDTSRQVIPFLDGPAADLAAKMLAICGGLAGQHSSLRVNVRGAPAATALTLVVGGVERAGVVTTNNGTAKFNLQTIPTPGAQLLDFDPRDQVVEIQDPVGTILATTETPSGTRPKGTRIRERASLSPTGVVPSASGRVEIQERRGVRDFDVEIEDVPNGAYTLSVDGIERGTINVVGGKGVIEFSDGGNDPDELPLNFDPLGALVQVAQGATVILSGTALADAPGLNVCTPSESTTPLDNVGPDPDADGDTRFRVKSDCDRDFQVEVEDLPAGSYEVLVGGVVRGTVNVVDLGAGVVQGEIEFDTDVDEPGEVLLDFDPVGKLVEVRQGGTVYLSSTVGAGAPGSCGFEDVEPDLVSTGVDPDADGKARFRQETDCDRDFRVEVEDLAVGSYGLAVAGIVRGAIQVVDTGAGDTEGELEFDSDPDEPGEILLDFDPRGKLVEVRQGGTVYLELLMPD